MSQQGRKPIVVGTSEAWRQLKPTDEVLGTPRIGDTIRDILVRRGLLRVLIVDDNRDAADSLAMLVDMWGHDARTAYDAAAALEIAYAYQPDVLLLDIGMPKVDGCRLTRQLRGLGSFADALMIAITGYADQAHRRLGEEAGIDLYLIKPVAPSTLEVLLALEEDRLARSSAALLPTLRRDGNAWEAAAHRTDATPLAAANVTVNRRPGP